MNQNFNNLDDINNDIVQQTNFNDTKNTQQELSNNQTFIDNKENDIDTNKMIIMILGLFTSLILLDSFISDTKWYLKLMIYTKNLKNTIDKLVIVANCSIVIIVTIFSIIYYYKNKNKTMSTSPFMAYIIAGIIYFFLGINNSITGLIYIISTLKECGRYKSKKSALIKIINIIAIAVYLIVYTMFFTHTGLFQI